MSRVSFFDERPSSSEVMQWYADVREALGELERKIVAAVHEDGPTPPAFLGMTAAEVSAYFDGERDELEDVTSLSLLAAAEAVLRMDYLGRVYERRKDPVSRAFRELHQTKGTHAALDEDLLEVWRTHELGAKAAVGEFRGVLKFRHWLAHGRYWAPKLGQQYEAQGVFDIITRLFAKLPGVSGWT